MAIKTCQYPHCTNRPQKGKALCRAHRQILRTAVPPTDTLKQLLSFEADGHTTIQEEIAYLMTLRRALDEQALACIDAKESFNLPRHATLQAKLTSQIIRALKIPRRSPAADPELAQIAAQVQDALAQEFPALALD